MGPPAVYLGCVCHFFKFGMKKQQTLDEGFTWCERMRMEAIGCSKENAMGSGVSQTRCLQYGMNPFICLLHPNLGLLRLYMRAACSKMPDNSDELH